MKGDSRNGHWSVLMFRGHGEDKEQDKKKVKVARKLGEKIGKWISWK